MKKVLIIGGSSGIGLASVKFFEKNGWGVVATFFSNTSIAKREKKTVWVYYDISQPDSLMKNFKTKELFDAVVICAVNNRTAGLDAFSEGVEDMFNINVINQIKLISFLKNRIKKNGSIVLFGSITGRIGSPRRIAYSSSKAAIHGAVKSLAAALAPSVRVNAVCPGYIKTAQYEKHSTINEEERRKVIALGRLGRPEEVAQLVFFLASDASSYVTGQMINIDGGVF